MYISRWTKLRQPRRRLSPHSSGVDEGAFAKFTPRRRFGARNQTGRMKGRRSLLSKVGSVWRPSLSLRLEPGIGRFKAVGTQVEALKWIICDQANVRFQTKRELA